MLGPFRGDPWSLLIHAAIHTKARCARSVGSCHPFLAWMPRMVLGNPRFARRLVYTRAPTRITIWILDATRIIVSVISSDDGRKTDVRARERPKKRADGCQKYYADKIFMVIGTRDRDRLYFPRWIEMVPPSPRPIEHKFLLSPLCERRKREVPREICYAVVSCVRQ